MTVLIVHLDHGSLSHPAQVLREPHLDGTLIGIPARRIGSKRWAWFGPWREHLGRHCGIETDGRWSVLARQFFLPPCELDLSIPRWAERLKAYRGCRDLRSRLEPAVGAADPVALLQAAI